MRAANDATVIPENRSGSPDVLKQRVITALIAAAILLLVLFVVPPPVARVVIAVLFLAGAWEWSAFLSLDSAAARLAYVALIGAIEALAWIQVPDAFPYRYILYAAVAWWLAAFVWTFFYPTPVPRLLGWIGGILVLVPAYVALDWLYTRSPQLLLFMLIIVWAADIGAFFAGKAFGRVKLAPAISPGKTWEGVGGGVLAVAVVALLGGLWTGSRIDVLLPFCLGVALASIIGDLTVSMFKRHAGLKDSGSLFPGHGGVLDRIDSVTAAAPLFAAGVALAGIQ